jgi:hypothetical protein
VTLRGLQAENAAYRAASKTSKMEEQIAVSQFLHILYFTLHVNFLGFVFTYTVLKPTRGNSVKRSVLGVKSTGPGNAANRSASTTSGLEELIVGRQLLHVFSVKFTSVFYEPL